MKTNRGIRLFGLCCTVLLAACLILSGCGGESTSTNGGETEGTITLSLGHVSAPDLPYDIASKGFAQEVEQATNGKIKIEVFGSGQLGGDRDMIEQVQLGTLDFYAGSTASLTNFVPELEVMDLPFLFKNYEHVYAALDGEVGELLTKKIETNGFKNLGFWEQGFKNISNNERAVRSAEDMEGIKMRIQESPLLSETYRALGADPTPIPFPEVYTSIQQGVADGYEGSFVPFCDVKLYEVQDYLSEVQISFGSAILLMNKDRFDSLDPEIQKTIVELGEKYAKEERRVNREILDNLRKTAISEDVEVISYDEIDIQSFSEAVKPVYEKYSQFDELVSTIRALEK